MKRIWEPCSESSTDYRIFDASARVNLDLLTPRDYDFIYSLASRAGQGWPWHGLAATAENLAASLWDGVSEQRVVRLVSGRPIAVVALYDVQMHHQTASARIYSVPSAAGQAGLALEGMAIFLDMCLLRYRLRKVYFETTSDLVGQFGTATKFLLTTEGHHRDRFYVDGRLCDMLILTLDRSRWFEFRDALMRSIRAYDRSAVEEN